MILSIEDIEKIMSIGYDKDFFVEYRDGYYRLKNVDNHCVFLDIKTGKCKIYRYRPMGCRIYPVIYDFNEGFKLDEECPAIETVSSKEFILKVKLLIKLLNKLGIEI